MDRNDMMSFEEMDKLEGDVNTDYENICYRIERVIHEMKENDGEVDLLELNYCIDDILLDCYGAEIYCSGMGTELIYYNEENHMNYEIIFDEDGVLEINIWEEEIDEEEEEDDDDDD